MKSVTGLVAVFPVRDQPRPLPPLPVTGVCHVASPVASDVRTFPAPGVPHVILTCPATSSFAHGLIVPIPRFPDPSILILSMKFVVRSQ